MRILRWMCRVTKVWQDKKWNKGQDNENGGKRGGTLNKVQERWLKWYGYVVRREAQYVGRLGGGQWKWKVQWRRKRRQPKRRWFDRVRCDIREATVGGSVWQSYISVLPRPFSKGGTPCPVLMTPCLFQEAEMTPCLFLVTPNDALLQFLFCHERHSPR